MNIIKRAYDRLTGVLGYDCNGKPLKKGDRVEIIADKMVREECIGIVSRVVARAAPNKNVMGGRLPRASLKCRLVGSTECLKKINDDEVADWGRIERSTGWKPQVREVKHG